MKRGIFLDRDGVINEAPIKAGIPQAPKIAADVILLPGALRAINVFRELNLEIVIITNQPDVKRGRTKREDAEAINAQISKYTGIENIYTCWHDDNDECECRKPKAGLILDSARDLKIDLSGSFLVGDRWKDIQAAQSVGLTALFVNYNYLEAQPKPPYKEVDSLFDASQHIKRSLR